MLVHDQRISSILLVMHRSQRQSGIETGHGFERKAGADRKREDGLIEASNHAMCSVTASALEYMYVYT